MTFLSGTQIKTALQNLLDTIPASDDKLLEWLQYINRQSFRGIFSVDPERLMNTVTIKVAADNPFVTVPKSFKNTRTIGCGLFKINDSGSYYQAIAYDAQTGAFTVGLTVTGGTSAATGVIESIYDDGTTGVLTLTGVSGTFEDNEALTDTSTGSATSDGTAQAFKESDKQLPITSFGASIKGHWIDMKNLRIVITPILDSVTYFRFRYITNLTDLSSLSDSTQIPSEFLQYARNWLDIYLQQYLANPNQEANANSRFINSLNTFLEDIRAQANIYSADDLSTAF